MINKKILAIRVFTFRIVKRLIDIIGSVFFIVLFSPFFLLFSLLIKISSPGPVLFSTQKRVGQYGKIFRILKFRSMRIGDNDKYLRENYPELWDKYKKSDWKLPADEDPRITPIGKFLRATSIDETPQFINVLKGEMSIVGHRPYRPEEIEEYAKRYPHTKKYIEIIKTSKPGITGLWQISGRNELNFEQRSKLDANYILHRSLRQELLIILKTPFAMLSIW